MAAATLGDVAVRVRGDTSGLKGDISQGTQGAYESAEPGIAKAGARAGGKFGGAFAKVAKVGIAGIAAAGTAAGIVIFKALSGGFNRLKAIDTAKAKLRGLGFQGVKLKKVMDAAANSVDGTAFGLDAAATAAGTLAAAGVEIADMEGTLKNVANLASVIGSDMQYAAGIFGEVAAQGKVTGNILTQMEQAGFGATAALAEGLKVSRAEVKQLAKDGKITAEQFNTAMKTKLGSAALEVGKSWSGVMANIKTRISKLGAQVLEPTFERLKKVATRFNEFLNELVKSDAFKGFGDRLAAEFDTIHNAMKRILPTGDQVKAFISGLAPKKPVPATGTGSVLAPFQGTDSPGGMRPPATPSPLRQGGATASGFEQFGGAVKGTLDSIMTQVGPLWDKLVALFNKGVKEIQPLLAELGQAFTQDLLPAFQAIMPVLGPVLKFLLGVLGGAVIGVIKGVIKMVIGAVKILSGLMNIIAGIFTGDWGRVWEGVKQIFSGAIKFIIGLIQFLWNWGIVGVFKKGFGLIGKLLTGGWNTIKALFKGGGKAVEGFWKATWAAVKGAFVGLWQGLKSVASSGWSAVSKFFSGMKGKVLGFFKGAGTWLKDVGKSIIDGLIKGISGATALVKKAIDWISSHIPQWAKDILHIGSPSKVMAMEVGRWIPAGIAEGMAAGAALLRKSASAMSNEITIGAGTLTAPRAPQRAGTAGTVPVQSVSNDRIDNRTSIHNNNFYGPESLSKARRQNDWADNWGTRFGGATSAGAQ